MAMPGMSNEAKARELAKVDTLEVEYWDAWKRSQQNAEVETTKMQGSDPDKPGRLEKQKRVEGQVGDPRFLAGVQWCIQKRCEILGVDAPEKQEINQHGDIKVIIEYADSQNPATPLASGADPDQERAQEI